MGMSWVVISAVGKPVLAGSQNTLVLYPILQLHKSCMTSQITYLHGPQVPHLYSGQSSSY